MSKKTVLMILDGFGIGKDSPFNAIGNARMPFFKELLEKYPHSQLLTHGEAVGLPEGVMGNSEVGHTTMGAGRIIYQDLTRISKSIRDKSFFKNETLKRTLLGSTTGRVHLMGLLSDGGVHSHLDHLLALLDLCGDLDVPHVSVHPFLDGRDTPPDSAPKYLERLLAHPLFKSRARVATLCGRYYAMDRDKRWERIEKAYRVLIGQSDPIGKSPLDAVQASYASGKTDEFLEPVLLTDQSHAMQDGDAVLFFNYRSDRAREITATLTEPGFSSFDRGKGFRPATFGAMTQYDENLKHCNILFQPQNLENIFGSWLERHGLKQFRTAETEKYAHVTFFFNGGRETPFVGEDRTLIPSPRDVETYDLKPEMSAFEVAAEARSRIESSVYDFVLMNFANADMVGHTGNYAATVRAMEALDRCIGTVVGAAEKTGYHVLITADHGNAEEMQDGCGRPHTQHTLNPVPAIWVAPGSSIAPKRARLRLADGTLGDLMPTLCELMQLKLPNEVTGRSLLPHA